MNSIYQEVIQFIDLTNLSNDLNQTDLITLCEKSHSKAYKVAAICVEKQYVSFCKKYLSSSGIPIASVFNFPNGDQEISKIQDDISECIAKGVDELDIVIPIKNLMQTDDVNQFKEIIVSFATEIRNFVPNKILKFIISTDVLQKISLIQAATEAVILAKADFVKTCTGKNGGGVTLEALQNMLDVIKNMKSNIGIKASGGIRNVQFAAEIYNLVKKSRGEELTPKNFRLGASGLLDDLLFHGQEFY
ncbi:MAG: deoxyribose-phosphate aldolase [Candidatus Berkiellales bacterium]